MSVEPLEVSCAGVLIALATQALDLKAGESVTSDVCFREVKFILNPVLPFCHFLGNLGRPGLGEFSIVSPDCGCWRKSSTGIPSWPCP